MFESLQSILAALSVCVFIVMLIIAFDCERADLITKDTSYFYDQAELVEVKETNHSNSVKNHYAVIKYGQDLCSCDISTSVFNKLSPMQGQYIPVVIKTSTYYSGNVIDRIFVNVNEL